MDSDLTLDNARKATVTPYDVLGYLVPGGFLVTCLAGYEGLLRVYSSNVTLHTPVHGAVSYLLRAGPRDSWATDTVALATFIAMMYVSGHVIASISALVVDRVYVAKGHGYPFQRILGIGEQPLRTTSAYFYRGMFLWLNMYLLLRYLGIPNGVDLARAVPEPFSRVVPSIMTQENIRRTANWLGWLIWILIASRVVVSAGRTGHAGRWEAVAETAPVKALVMGLERLIAALAKPALFFTHLFGMPLHARKQLDQATCDAFKTRLERLIAYSNKTPGQMADFLKSTSAYWFCALHVRAAAPALEVAAENWLRLYSFARNLATAMYLAFLYCSLSWLNLPPEMQFTPANARITLFAVPVGLFAAAFVLLLRYYYLYADYYTKYLIRAIVYLNPQKPVAVPPALA